MATEIHPNSERHFEGLRQALDIVAREGRYLAFLQAPPPQQAYAFYRGIIDNGLCQYIAVNDGTVVGWCDILENRGEACAHVGTLGIGLIPSARGQGLGRRLLQRTLEAGWRRGYTRIELDVRADNPIARGLYERFGFVEEGLRRKAYFVGGCYYDGYSMALLR